MKDTNQVRQKSRAVLSPAFLGPSLNFELFIYTSNITDFNHHPPHKHKKHLFQLNQFLICIIEGEEFMDCGLSEDNINIEVSILRPCGSKL